MPIDKCDVEVDKHKLDEELEKQTGLFLKYSFMAADTRKAMEESKSMLDLVRSELSLDIRANPEDYGLEKVTEAVVEAAVVKSPKHRKAVKDTIQARHDYEVASAVVASLEHKRSALSKLVELYQVNYFGRTRPSGMEDDNEESTRHVRRRGRRET